jgi:hypothetical protein
MEKLHNSNTSEDIIPDGLMGLSKEAITGIFEQINTEKGQKNVNIQSVPEVIHSYKNVNIQSVPEVIHSSKNVNIQSVPEVIQIPNNDIMQHKVIQQPPQIQVKQPNVNIQSILKQAKPTEVQSNQIQITQVQPTEVQSNQVQPSQTSTEPIDQTTTQNVITNTQYLKIMNFEISRTTLYFAIGLIILIGIYYYMQHRSNTQKEDNSTKIRRGGGRYTQNNDQNDQYDE